jgi:putative transposase
MCLPRPIHANETLMLTRRTNLRHKRLNPRHGTVEAHVRYCLGKAQREHGLQVHAVIVLSNHIHALVTDRTGDLPAAVGDLFSLTARSLNSRHGFHGSLWDSRQPHYLVLEGEETVWKYLIYVMANAVSSHLVRSARLWPGLITLPGQLCRTTEAPRPDTKFFERSKLQETEQLTLSIPPALSHLTPEQFRAEAARRLAEREEELRADAQESGIRFLGARAVLRGRRDEPPNSSADSGDRVPLIADTDKERRRQRIKELQRFRLAYGLAREGWLRGEPGVCFPAGTYKLRTCPGVLVEAASRSRRQAQASPVREEPHPSPS